ncbi:MAG: NAD-dependent epimerase/dehydratase family protein [Oceanipulchritudo sp.]
MEDSGATVLVTGATGFLGRRLCERLRSEGVRVVALGRRAGAGPWEEFLEVDLASAAPESSQLKGVSTIYHLACKAHAVPEWANEADNYRPVVVEGTRRMLDSAREAGIPRFIHMSSVKAMGEGNPPGLPLHPMDEAWPHTPQSPYGMAKAEAEKLVLESGLPHAVVLRPVMVYGPGGKGNLPQMVEAVRRGRFPPIPDNGNRRSMIHVDDLVEFSIRAAIYPIGAGKVYILAGPQAHSTRELYDLIRQSLGMPGVTWSIPSALLQAAAFAGSILGALLNRRLPLDRETLRKLTGSAWYSSARASCELDYTACHTVKEWLALEKFAKNSRM